MAPKQLAALVVCALVGAGLFWWTRKAHVSAEATASTSVSAHSRATRAPNGIELAPPHDSPLSFAAIFKHGRFDGADYARFNLGMKLRETTGTLRLTSREKEKLTNIYVACVLAKAAIETDIVQTIDDRADRLTLKIPSYPEEGAELKAEFKRVISATFPGDRADAIDDHFGRFFDERLLGFGVTEQKIVITREQDGVYRIVRTSKISPGETITGFREQSPLSEVQSTALLTYDQIRTGEYVSIFPRLSASSLRSASPSR